MNPQNITIMPRVLLAVSLFIFTACQNDRRLSVMDQAGENRTELEKVLQHYKDDAQELKAEYLIAHIDHAFQAWTSVYHH